MRVGCKCKCGVYTQDKLYIPGTCVCTRIKHNLHMYMYPVPGTVILSSASRITAHSTSHEEIEHSTHIFKLITITKKLPGVQLREYIYNKLESSFIFYSIILPYYLSLQSQSIYLTQLLFTWGSICINRPYQRIEDPTH